MILVHEGETGRLFKKAQKAAASGDFKRAGHYYRDLLRTDPANADALNGLGLVLFNTDDVPGAADCFRRATEAAPQDAESFNNLGIATQMQGNHGLALQHFQKALDLRPEFASAINNFGKALEELGKIKEANVCYRRALEIDPHLAQIYNNLGINLKRQGKSIEAKEWYRKALKIQPNFPEVCSNLAAILKDEGDLEEAVRLFKKAVEQRPQFPVAHSNLVFTLNYLPGKSPKDVFAEHQRWGAHNAKPALMARSHANVVDPGRRLRIGYVSPDYRDHSVSFFIEPIIAAHAADQFETFAYAEVAAPDATTKRLKSKFHHWRSTVGKSTEQVCEMIRADGIDILVDLAGHSQANRLLVFARKPAPVQVTYLGYPNTTGVCAIDYRLSDEWCDPEANQAFCTEKLFRLPTGFLCYDPPVDAPDVCAPPAVHKGYVTFGSFNVACKINEPLVEQWCRILSAVPNSKLVLKSHLFAEAHIRELYSKWFSSHSIGLDRITMLAWEPSRSNHLSLYGEVDIALDSYPYHGTTTTCEALWMGVPVLTLAGEAHASRVGVSLLTRVGIPEFIAQTPDEYVAKAVAFAGDLQKLSTVRQALRQQMRGSSLCNRGEFVRSLEAAYRSMWQSWCNVQPGIRKTQSQVEPAAMVTSPSPLPAAAVETAPAVAPPEAATVAAPAGTLISIEAPKPARNRPRGRVAELAILADSLAKMGRRSEALQYTLTGLGAVLGGHYDGGVPPILLDEWNAPSAQGLLLRQALTYSCYSSYFAREQCHSWLMQWAKTESNNPEPFLRFGLLVALQAISANKPIPKPAWEALHYAAGLSTDDRAECALALLKSKPAAFTVALGQARLHVSPELTNITTYTMLEQGDWFEDELDLFRNLLRGGDKVLDLGANVGIYGFSAAQLVGAAGKVVFVEPAHRTFGFVSKTAEQFNNVQLINAAVGERSGMGKLLIADSSELNKLQLDGADANSPGQEVDILSVDEIARKAGCEHFDVIKMDVEGCEIAALNGGQQIFKQGSPIVLYEVKEGSTVNLKLIDAFKVLGYESYTYIAGQNLLIPYDKAQDMDVYTLNMIAVKPEALGRLAGVVQVR